MTIQLPPFVRSPHANIHWSHQTQLEMPWLLHFAWRDRLWHQKAKQKRAVTEHQTLNTQEAQLTSVEEQCLANSSKKETRNKNVPFAIATADANMQRTPNAPTSASSSISPSEKKDQQEQHFDPQQRKNFRRISAKPKPKNKADSMGLQNTLCIKNQKQNRLWRNTVNENELPNKLRTHPSRSRLPRVRNTRFCVRADAAMIRHWAS